MTDERKGECEGNRDKCNLPECPKFGLLGRASRDGKRRVRGCNDPAARGKRNRTKGDAKARHARRKLGLSATGNAGSRHEEHWAGFFRVEVKAGLQVGPLATRFYAAKTQSDASKALGGYPTICNDRHARRQIRRDSVNDVRGIRRTYNPYTIRV